MKFLSGHLGYALRDEQLQRIVGGFSSVTERIGDLPDRLVIGDAADRRVMERVGVEVAPSILLSTNDDATNIYLSSYCRRLSPEAQIVSRITHGT